MKHHIFSAVIGLGLLAGCDGTNPFMVATAPDGTTENVDPTDPNTSVNSKFAFDRTRGLTMNSVVYDATNDDLIINNLPFDGTAGRYDRVPGTTTTNATGIERGAFASRQTATTGLIQHYAVFVRGDYLEATAAAGRDWTTYGNAGANINRDSFRLPLTAETEYVFLGVYAGTRTYNERSGIELVTGDVTLLLDTADFDLAGNLQGDILGNITNRVRITPGRTGGGDLPDISLTEVSFNPTTGVWEDGAVRTWRPNGDPRDTGTHDGMFGGPNGDEMGGYIVMEGVADIQVVTYEVQTYDDGNGGVQTVTGLSGVDGEVLQNMVNNFIIIPYLPVDTAAIPPGWTLLTSTNATTEIDTDFNAREVGVYVADRVIP